MRRVLWLVGLCAACGPRPVALFTVDCANDECDTLHFAVQAGGGGDQFTWSVDGVPVSTGPSYDHPGDLTAAEYVTLRSTTLAGSDVRGVWVVASEVVEPDATGWAATAQGFELIEEKDRIVDTECGPLAIVTSIGGCFTGSQPIAVHLSHANLSLTAPPSPLSSANYDVPATYTPGLTPDIARGGWDGARAHIPGSPPLALDWDPALDSVVTTVPRYETAKMLASLTDTHWGVLEVPDVGFHRNAVLMQCDGDHWEVGSTPLPDETLDAWFEPTRP